MALQYSDFSYKELNDAPTAIDVADNALARALMFIDEIEEDWFRDIMSIIELLKENLTLYREEEGD